MMDFDEPVLKMESSDDDLIDLTRMSDDEIIKLAKGKYGKRDGGDRSKWSVQFDEFDIYIGVAIATAILIGPILLDTLFLFVPIINENIKCLALDEKLKIIALVLRSFTDLPFLLVLLYHVRPATWFTWPAALSFLEALLDELIPKSPIYNILAVLPVPQIVILIFLPKTRNSGSLNIMKFLNSLILLQYVARAYPLYRVCKEVNKDTRENTKTFAKEKIIWIIGALNFIMYILASHVLGAFWYFFSVQREIDCWISTCRSENGCDLSTLQCDNTTFRNVTLVNYLCPTNPPNQTVYDFGIFVGTLQSGIGTTNFPKKLLMCFSWGLRNLSSFASNLNPSSYAWEAVFVIFISISGLLLFIYLLGHLQTFMQAISRTATIRQRMRVIVPQIDFMLSEYGLRTPSIDFAIWELVKEALEEDEDRPTENIFSLLPLEFKKHMKRHLFLATLRKLPGLENKDIEVLDAIMKPLEPVNYADGSCIVREGEPLDRMLFITQGIALAYKTTTTGGGSGLSSTTHLEKGNIYGKELIGWAAKSTPFSGLPISDKTVRSHAKLEVFALVANDLRLVVSQFQTQFNTERSRPADSTLDINDSGISYVA